MFGNQITSLLFPVTEFSELDGQESGAEKYPGCHRKLIEEKGNYFLVQDIYNGFKRTDPFWVKKLQKVVKTSDCIDYTSQSDVGIDGNLVLWHKNGQKELETYFIDGQPDGPWISYYDDGSKNGGGNYKEGKRDGLWVYWQSNGDKYFEGWYKDGKKDSLWVYWYNKNQKSREEFYIKGKAEGQWTTWYTNGQKMKEENYKEGSKTGLWTYWYHNGQKREEGNCLGGTEVGIWAYWNEEGQKRKPIKKVQGSCDSIEIEEPTMSWYKNPNTPEYLVLKGKHKKNNHENT